MKKLTAKKKIRQIRMLKKNLKKMEKRKNKTEKDKKEAAIKAVAYSCLIILLGSFVIPESSKVVWPYLESLRYLAIAAFIVLEVTTILTVFFAIKASLIKDKDPDLAISKPIERVLGKGAISSLLSFEARVWTYALFSKKIRQQNWFHQN